ncbi:MAG TPA: hypothetical protein DCL21_03270 [Alphaproteobacteria bacterium]|nr:hypothetical protein [Alphaproteobacteria bacterium]
MAVLTGNKPSQIIFLTESISRIFEKNNHSSDYVDIDERRWIRFFKLDASRNDRCNINIGDENRRNTFLMLHAILKDYPDLQELVESCFCEYGDYFCGENLLQLLSKYNVEDLNENYVAIKSSLTEYFDKPVQPCRIGYGVLQVLDHGIELEKATYNVAIAQWDNKKPYINEYEDPKRLFIALKYGFELEHEEAEDSPSQLILTCLALLALLMLYFTMEWSYIAEEIGL